MAIRMVIGSCSRAPVCTISWRQPISRIMLTMPFSSISCSNSTKKLILYSKPGCCLCDGLKEKLSSAFELSTPLKKSLVDVELQFNWKVRDITSNPEWEKAYQYEIPVLAKVRPDGTEEVLPRLSPRLGVEMIQKKIADALS
ncbi:hypothetical protein Leryth_018789 [Lithospermum erythrorhizon]|uniref:Glutaredoxin-like protein n=1 Tax=Lithospermum erythrorhizon TaxID=34254 RepID=A0AAV3QT53_LITER|nr:hypothetical protein Leryth_018789 [Lithospermum erythrorhizon]